MTGYDWPRGFDRTHPNQREPYPHGFRVSTREAFENIITQLDRLGAEDYAIATDADHQTRNPNLPYADADPEDPSVVVRYSYEGSRYAIPCDRWDNLRDNAQAIAKYIDAKRALNRYGVETRTTEWETQIIDSDSGGSSGSAGASGGSDDTPGETVSDEDLGTTDTEVYSPNDAGECPECGFDLPDVEGVAYCPDCGEEL